MKNIMYRSEDLYGSGERNILEIMVYEIYELENTDILDYCLNHYLQGTSIEETVQELENDVEAFEEDEIYDICKLIIDEINQQTGHNLKYALWLADKEIVSDMYADYEETIEAYRTSDVILSDLGRDSILFAYDKMPFPENF